MAFTNERQLNGGKQGSGSGLDADKVDNTEPANMSVDNAAKYAGVAPSNGTSGQILETDGTNVSWVAKPSGGVQGETGNERVEYGQLSYSGSGADTVSYATAFSTAPRVQSNSSNAYHELCGCQNVTTSSFDTGKMDVNGSTNSGTIDWLVIGE